jgi:anti-anti-sigma factor
MELIQEKHGRVVLIIARGRLDGRSSEEFNAQLTQSVITVEPRLVVDLSGIEFLSSAGLRVLLAASKRIKAASGMLALCSIQAPIREILEITGFDGILDVHIGRAEAIAALS